MSSVSSLVKWHSVREGWEFKCVDDNGKEGWRWCRGLTVMASGCAPFRDTMDDAARTFPENWRWGCDGEGKWLAFDGKDRVEMFLGQSYVSADRYVVRSMYLLSKLVWEFKNGKAD